MKFNGKTLFAIVGTAGATDLDFDATSKAAQSGIAVKQAIDTRAPAIIASAEGENIELTDSAAYPVQDLKLYVKATQSGEGDPTPTNIRPITHRESVRLFMFDSGAITFYDNTIAMPENSCFGYVDYMRNKYVQTHGVFVLKGTEGFYHWIQNVFRLQDKKVAQASNWDTKFDGVCSHYTASNHSQVYNGKTENSVCMLHQTNAIAISDSRFGTDAAAFNAYLAEQYAAGTPVTVIYKLATPVEHDLEELPEIATLYPTTYVAQNGIDNMAISYVADTKNYIDNKLNEIATAIVANA